jgi:hypothetical protein
MLIIINKLLKNKIKSLKAQRTRRMRQGKDGTVLMYRIQGVEIARQLLKDEGIINDY